MRIYVELLLKWNARINLIGRSTEEEVWRRHIEDSLQLLQLAPASACIWADLGSGGGLPGMVVAAALADQNPTAVVHLVESDQRKAAFLREAARLMSVAVVVHAQRIEAVAPLNADVISARALAPLIRLCDFASRHLRPGGLALFPKGANWRDELAKARQDWVFRATPHISETAESAVILAIEEITHV